jgi:hypothetical protein
MFELLTFRALAFWILDDGQHVKRGGITLCTDSFTYKEVLNFKSVLELKYNFMCTIHKKQNKTKTKLYYRIYISAKDLPILYSLVYEFMCPSMLYKINYKLKAPLSMTKKNINSREDRAKLRLWKT